SYGHAAPTLRGRPRGGLRGGVFSKPAPHEIAPPLFPRVGCPLARGHPPLPLPQINGWGRQDLGRAVKDRRRLCGRAATARKRTRVGQGGGAEISNSLSRGLTSSPTRPAPSCRGEWRRNSCTCAPFGRRRMHRRAAADL